jgi:hypothetical protein
MAAVEIQALMHLAEVMKGIELQLERQTSLLEDIADELCGPAEDPNAPAGEKKDEPANGGLASGLAGEIGRFAELKKDLKDLAELGSVIKPKE